MFSIRIVNSDFYIATPVPDLDVCNSTFRETATFKVPVIRIYGATPGGQKTCLHVHGIFPYIYVPYDGTQPTEKYVKQFATSVDFAVQVALGKASSSRQHVYEISVVKGIPFYGYHEGEKDFLKISLYNPFLVTRVVSLLQSGAIMNKVFQPHEAHIPYLLQFFMDYNLYGMNLLHASAVKFRNPIRLVNGEAAMVLSCAQTHKSPQLSPPTTPSQIWNEDTVPREWILGSDVERLSFCELEVDALASDILNKLEIGVNIGTNPGLAAIWEDEQQRRRDANETSQISGPSSQDRGLIQETETEKQFKERIKEIIEERDLLIQSQMGKLGREALSPQELASFQDSICSLAASQRDLVADDSLDADAVSQLLSQHVQGMLGEGSLADSSQVVVDEDEPVVNQSIVREVVEASQGSFSQDLSSSMDKEMIDILANLAEEASPQGSQKATLSQIVSLDQGDAPCDEEDKDDEEPSDTEESIMMSQRFWDDIEHHSLGSGDEQVTDEQGSHGASQRSFKYNLEGMSDTWTGSFLGGDIPQLDGAADKDSNEQEEFRIPRKNPGKGRARKISTRPVKASKTTDKSIVREIPFTRSVHVKTQEKNTEQAETEETLKRRVNVERSGESVSEDVWPQKVRAIRTYSKKGLSAQTTKRTPLLDEEKVEERDEDEAIVADGEKEEEEEEEEEEDKEEEEEEEEKEEEEEEEDKEEEEEEEEEEKEEEVDRENAFRLVLSGSSDSEDNNSKGFREGSEERGIVSRQENRELEGDKDSEMKASTARKANNKRKVNLESERNEIISREENMELEVEKGSEITTSTARKDKTRYVNLYSEGTLIVSSRGNSELEVEKSRKVKSSTARKHQDRSECYSPVITKYFHSPDKKPEGIKTRQSRVEQSPSSSQQTVVSCKQLDVHSTSAVLPQLSQEQETYLRKSTLRKRKLSEIDKNEGRPSKRATSRRAIQNKDLAASLSAVSGAMANLKVPLDDVSQIPTLNSKFGEARTRLRNRCKASRQNYTRIVDVKLSSPVRKETLSQKRSPLQRSPLSKKRTSPKRKEERMKKYGMLPVVIAKSPKKNSAENNQLTETSSQQSLVDTSVLTSQVSRDPSSCSNVFSSGTGLDETEPSSSRGWTREVAKSRGESSHRGVSPEMISVAFSGGNKKTTRKGTASLPSRQLSLKSASSKGDMSRSETCRTLSLQSRGLKRRLVIDAEKDQQLTPVNVLPGTGKKRKLSLKLNTNSSRTFPRKKDVDETSVTQDEERLVEDGKSVDEEEKRSNVPHSQQAGVNIVNSERLLGLDNKKEFPLNKGLLEDITSVPSSPGEPDSSDETSPTITKFNSLSDAKKAHLSNSKSQERSDAFVTTGNELKTPDIFSYSLNNSQLLSQEDDFPNEKDTELLANALFNMSFPSPLPCWEQCYSPPFPSSPLETDCAISYPRDQRENLDEIEVFTISSSFVEEGNLSDVVEAQRLPTAPLPKQVQETAYFSPAATRVPEGSSLLPLCPQLGETQTELESMSNETDNFLGQKICEKEITGDNEFLVSHKSFVHKSSPNTNEEVFVMEEITIEENNDSGSNSEIAIYDDKSCGSKIVRGNERDELSDDVTSPESERTRPLENKMIDLTDRNKEKELSTSGTEEKEFVLRLSTEEESSTDAQTSAHSNLHVSEMKISLEEENDNRVNEVSSECVRAGMVAAFPSGFVGQTKDLTSSTHVAESRPNCSSGGLGIAGVVAIKPLKLPPTSDELINSLKDYGLPQCKYQEPFCSNPDDIPPYPREVGGRVLRIESKEVSNLAEFESSSSLQGLKHWRMVMSSARECGIQSICQSMDDATTLHKNLELKIALMGDGDVVVTPCRGPPAPETVKAWARDKLAKRKVKGQKEEEDLASKKVETKEPSADENLENTRQDQVSQQKKMDSIVSKTPSTELGQDIPATSGSKIPLREVSEKCSGSSVSADAELLVENKQKALDDVTSEKKLDVMELSDSTSPIEVTSPCSLFSPNEAKMSTFAFATELVEGRCKLSHTENHNQNEIPGTQPMGMECRDVRTEREEIVVTSSTNSVTVTPSLLHSPEQSPSTTSQLLSPLLQTQTPVFPAPYHSTPVATKLVYGAQSPRCTPISDATTKVKRLDTNTEMTERKNDGHQASSDQTPSLRQQLLASQFKFVTPGAHPRRSMPWSSQIEGPSPNNTYGFKVTHMNLQDAKALHEVQHLTLFSLELHVRTRRDARPDPEFDPICAIFYFIQTDTPLSPGKNKVTGIICVDSESAKITTSGTENKDRSLPDTKNTTGLSPYKDAVASTSTSNVTMSKATQNTSVIHSRPLLSRSGVTDYEVQYVAEEKDLFPALLDIIRQWDPDILMGYEVQMLSWGFLLERALTFEIDLCTRLSRVKGSSSESNMDAEKDRWGAAHTSEIKIAGRIILNVWRLMRHEVTLTNYSFENVAFHVLHERIPLFTFRTLSDWWDHRTSLNRWRTVDHYVTRCRGNVRILESVDFIGRTSELARLFGILFYSVISRGSQYRVESMMLRIAKPMNYIPVSPSVEQRGAMRAPETIPLVMEPESRFYSDPVLVLDFQSLYPSMIIAYNYCFSTCLGRVSCLSEYGEFKFGATSLYVPPSVLKKLEGDIHISPNGVAYVKPSVRKGILPSMLDGILKTRIMVKTSMKKWKADKSLGRMLDARQLGLKLIANVTFGYTSAHFSGRMPCVEIGDSIVRKARETLERAIDLVNNTPRWGARVVYGDTDSMFVLLKGATKEQAFSIGKDIVDTVTAMNPKPVKLKFEKVYLPCVLQTKKRYVGYMYETLDQREPVFDAKGIETVRRDSCPAVAKILEKSLRILFETRDLSLVKKFVQRQCTKLMEGRASLQDFTFAKEYRGMKNYKPGACVPALELTRRMLREDRRSEPRVGERVPYVVVYGSPGLPLIQLVRRPHEVLQDPGLRLNASYYITKQILPPLNRVFSLIGLDVFTWYAELPRVVRVMQAPTDPGDKKKGTIAQYFSTMNCPVCQELTPTDLCSNCHTSPQMSAVTLMNRMRGWERTHQHLAEICYGCCGSRDTKLSCVSLDCPVFYKLVQCTRDVKSTQHLRRILESL